MPNSIISLCGTNYGGGNLGSTSTANVSYVPTLLGKIWVPYENFKKFFCKQLLLQVVLLLLHLLL